MRKAEVFFFGKKAGVLEETEKNRTYRFVYDAGYEGSGISLTMPADKKIWEYDTFPPFFEGLLPEGFNLDALLRMRKIDRNDNFAQLTAVGEDLPGAVTVYEMIGDN